MIGSKFFLTAQCLKTCFKKTLNIGNRLAAPVLSNARHTERGDSSYARGWRDYGKKRNLVNEILIGRLRFSLLLFLCFPPQCVYQNNNLESPASFDQSKFARIAMKNICVYCDDTEIFSVFDCFVSTGCSLD